MASLTPAHRGYEYQDLLIACRVVDMLLDTVTEAHVDSKLVEDDRFDDLTVRDASGRWERSQFKHTDAGDSPLKLRTFTVDATRGLRLDRLVAAAVAFRDDPDMTASSVQFRVVMRGITPTDAKLATVLKPATLDPGPFLAGMPTTRFSFSAEALWPTEAQVGLGTDGNNAFAFLRTEGKVDRADLAWLCDHLVVEVGAPAMSMDLRNPGPAEQLLLDRVHQELGAGLYPNEDRSAVDVAEALIRTVRAARNGGPAVTRQELLRRTQLRQDFGAVVRAHPVDPAMEVPRATAVAGLVAAVEEAAVTGGAVIASGSPGQGKSWACQQLVDRLDAEGWVVAEHYCYLGDADGDRLPRVMAETVFGSLLARVADADPGVAVEQRPRFAADEQALVSAVESVVGRRSGRRVALVIDGLDHVTRVQVAAHRTRTADPSFALAEALSALQLPEGSALIVLSQPGRHLQPLEQAGAITIQVPPLTESELGQLAARLGVVPSSLAVGNSAEPLLADEATAREFLRALAERSAGNALYATYLCREVRVRPEGAADAAAVVRALPSFDGTLESYYAHLYSTLGDGAWVADVLALLDVPVTRQELREIMPESGHRVKAALDVLSPVLADRAGEGGLRVYHESFARYLRLPYQDDPEALVAVLDRIAQWLSSKGLFTEPRAFSSLLRVLADAGHDADVTRHAGRDFVTRAVAAGYPASMIRSNLATVVRCAARSGDWAAAIRCVELSRAAETYQYERFDSALIEHAGVPISLLGAQAVADRLVHDGHPVMPGRAGVQMCAAVDAAGGVAPWRQYLAAFWREAETDNTSYGRDSDLQVSLAVLRGRLRLSVPTGTEPPSSGDLEDLAAHPPDHVGDPGKSDEIVAPVSLRQLATLMDRQQPYKIAVTVVRALADTHGWWAVAALTWQQAAPGATCLALAEEIAAGRCPGEYGSARTWAAAAAAHGVPAGSAHRLLRLGLDPDDVSAGDVARTRQRLLDLTHRVQQHGIQHEGEAAHVADWLDLLCIAARRDDLGLNTAEALITGPGWYRCWLRFTVALARAEHASASECSPLALQALSLLTEEADPFAGDPRACDLYGLRPLIGSTIRRAVALLGGTDWEAAVHRLTEVSATMTTTMRGELSGPLPPDELLEMVVSTATPGRYAAAEAIVRSETETGAAGRYYSDLARYRMTGARLAVSAGDRDRAEALWADACRFLTAYGWHKDITIYELLDPLPALIAADPARGRAAVAMAQPLCERVPMHTDGKETRHAWRQWWKLLADADPSAAAQLLSPAMLANCNMPGGTLDEARHDLWERWHASADPIAAAALRLTLEAPLVGADPAEAARLAKECEEVTGSLLRLILCRADERPDDRADDDASAATNEARLAELNLVAERSRAPRVQASPLKEPRRPPETGNQPAPSSQGSLQQQLESRILPEFPAGVTGLSRVIRAWHGAPFDDRRSPATLNRFAGLIGYRLIELAESGRETDAVAVLGVLGGSAGYSEGALLLGHLAEGLERHGHHGLATQAYALAWTRTRGGSGWLNFGGETALDALQNATRLDPVIATNVVADETERLVASSRYGTWGVTQALVIAFATGALTVPDRKPVDAAFAIWEEALAVIADRAPRVDASDDPDQPYTEPRPDDGSRIPGDLDVAFAAAALAGLSDASFESKRRSLLAAQALITQRPEIAAPAVAIALASLSDPATLTWLLCLIGDSGAEGRTVAQRCTPQLRMLAQGRYLTIRAIARRMLPLVDAGTLPLGPSDASLIMSPGGMLWVPEEPEDDEGPATELVLGVAGARLADAEPLVPGLASAVLHQVAAEYASPELRNRMRAQLRAYRDSRIQDHSPDAYLAVEQLVEEVLQRTASGARAARIAAGRPTGDPAAREDELARTLTDSPQLPLALEATRYPRPPIPAPPTDISPIWPTIASAARGTTPPPTAVVAAQAMDGKLMATVSMQPVSSLAMIEGGPHDGWYAIGTAERLACPPRHYGDSISRSYRYSGLEVREEADRRGLGIRPLAVGDTRQWMDPRFGPLISDLPSPQPLVAIDHPMTSGLGLPSQVLVPTSRLIEALGLRAATPVSLDDDEGTALALITWRTCYKRSDYYLAWPHLTGCAVVMRPDLMSRLADRVGKGLVIRDFVAGDEVLAQPPLSPGRGRIDGKD